MADNQESKTGESVAAPVKPAVAAAPPAKPPVAAPAKPAAKAAADKGGAPTQVREARAANLAHLRNWLDQEPNQSSEQLARRFKDIGVAVSAVTIRRYKMELSR